MFQSIKQLYSETLRALDGEIGHVKDFYLTIRTGLFAILWRTQVLGQRGAWCSWLLMLSAASIKTEKSCSVNLARKQIENSPSIDTHRPVSRQFKEEYYQYYGWPSYWMGDLMWGISDFPALARLNGSSQNEKANASGDCHELVDPNLRSTQAMLGYHIQASDGSIGHVSDFIVDDESWAIHRLVAGSGNWLSGKEVLISLSQIDESTSKSEVFVKLTKEAIRQREYHDPPVGTADHAISPPGS